MSFLLTSPISPSWVSVLARERKRTATTARGHISEHIMAFDANNCLAAKVVAVCSLLPQAEVAMLSIISALLFGPRFRTGIAFLHASRHLTGRRENAFLFLMFSRWRRSFLIFPPFAPGPLLCVVSLDLFPFSSKGHWHARAHAKTCISRG
jgi:hypothetical protein